MTVDVKTGIAEMATSGKRVRVHDSQAVIKLPRSVKKLVRDIADARHVSEATVIREAIAEYLTKRGYNR